ncbi:hypothetical protein DFJ58DRAFT_718084 [Suillus subalutaceus]|uniref:uncharacterized protein n=1 Tax=Suillus subalutaceus TaxID=48586 RepID=UPI001B871574|nr:uncharacterized protein DFJ58DRAFT_718084 [Suillus subalutaceus]KAG1841901.1 hypothetical protein DFJ58DRAFT_718084 [Suillus subalutaceus]
MFDTICSNCPQYEKGVFPDDEEADKYAKLASEGHHNDSPVNRLPRYLRHCTLPLSISALKELQGKTTAERWKLLWNTSPRSRHINRLGPNILKRSFIKLSTNFPKRLTSMYIFLHTGHAPLKKYLHRIRKSAIHHYLLVCPQYQRERHILATALGRRASSIQFLLSESEATHSLVEFINATGRLRATLSEVPTPRILSD